MNDTKSAFLSKLNWQGMLMVLLPAFAPPVQAAIAAHPAVSSAVAGALVVVLRTFFTSQPVSVLPQ